MSGQESEPLAVLDRIRSAMNDVCSSTGLKAKSVSMSSKTMLHLEATLIANGYLKYPSLDDVYKVYGLLVSRDDDIPEGQVIVS